jgi:hypothetical protein
MFKRLAIAVLAFALLILVAPPAAAKSPPQVSVRDERTGTTTVLNGLDGPGYVGDWERIRSIEELVEWPSETTAPKPLVNGRAELIATLTWQYDEQTPAWVDSIYVDPMGRTWVERLDQMSGTESITWGRVNAGAALATVLTAISEPGSPTKAAPAVPTTRLEEQVSSSPSGAAGASSHGWDAASFAGGAGSAGLLAVGLLGAWWWRQRSVTASRNSRVSTPAAS